MELSEAMDFPLVEEGAAYAPLGEQPQRARGGQSRAESYGWLLLIGLCGFAVVWGLPWPAPADAFAAAPTSSDAHEMATISPGGAEHLAPAPTPAPTPTPPTPTPPPTPPVPTPSVPTPPLPGQLGAACTPPGGRATCLDGLACLRTSTGAARCAVRCVDGTFASTSLRSGEPTCEACSTCGRGTQAVRPCDATSDTQCACAVGFRGLGLTGSEWTCGDPPSPSPAPAVPVSGMVAAIVPRTALPGDECPVLDPDVACGSGRRRLDVNIDAIIHLEVSSPRLCARGSPPAVRPRLSAESRCFGCVALAASPSVVASLIPSLPYFPVLTYFPPRSRCTHT